METSWSLSLAKVVLRTWSDYITIRLRRCSFFLDLNNDKKSYIFVCITKPLMCALKNVWIPKLKLESWMDSTTYLYLPSLHKTQAKNLVKCQGCMNKLMQIALFSCFFSSFFSRLCSFLLKSIRTWFAYRLLILTKSLLFNILSEKFDRLFYTVHITVM